MIKLKVMILLKAPQTGISYDPSIMIIIIVVITIITIILMLTLVTK